VHIVSDAQQMAAMTGPDGRFALTVPAGRYRLEPQLPDDVIVLDDTSRQVVVQDGGCATATINALLNGRIRGVLRGHGGQPLVRVSVDLVPADIERDERSGHVRGMGSVTTDLSGQFEFPGRPAGRYYLGVNLYNSPPVSAAYPRTYYPGTTDPTAATLVIVERGRATDGYDFTVGPQLAKGEVEVRVRADNVGKLSFCIMPLDSMVKGWSTYEARPGVPQRLPVVDSLRYEVHAHLEAQGQHLESEPQVVVGNAVRSVVVELRPDAPRALHP
jgi:hypothetical protein